MMQQLRRAALALAFTLVAAPAFGQASQGSSPLTILKGGTGAISAAAARVNLGFGSTANRLYGTDGSGVSTQVTLPATGLTLSAGALTFANDLAALEALSSTGILRRTGTDTWSLGTAVANSELATMAAYTLKGNATGSSATPTDISIPALTTKASPDASDLIPCIDVSASNEIKKCTVASLASAGSVSSIDGNTGAFTTSRGLEVSGNAIRRKLDEATLLGAPSNPAGISSGSELMMGLGVSTCRITPVYSTRIHVTIDGNVVNNTAGQVTNLRIRYGSGTGPSNAASATGTAVGSITAYSGVTGNLTGFSKTALITGLTPSTTYWLDIAMSTSANTGTIAGVTCTAYEF